MENDLGLKLIAVADLNKLRLYEAQGIKILKQLELLPLSLHKEHNHEQGLFKKGFSPASAFEPHTSEKELEHDETAKIVTKHLEKVVARHNNYKELIITAESKLLGAIRKHLSNHLKQIITKELVKDLAHQDMKAIEHTVFS